MKKKMINTLRDALEGIAMEAEDEALSAAAKWPAFNSAHEGFAVLGEEVDELAEAANLEPVILSMCRLWGHVKVNQKKRDVAAMRAEAVQVAAMAIRFVHDVCDGGRGRA